LILFLRIKKAPILFGAFYNLVKAAAEGPLPERSSLDPSIFSDCPCKASERPLRE